MASTYTELTGDREDLRLQLQNQALRGWMDHSPSREAYEWFASNIDEMRSCFSSDGFFFSVGFVSFTATQTN